MTTAGPLRAEWSTARSPGSPPRSAARSSSASCPDAASRRWAQCSASARKLPKSVSAMRSLGCGSCSPVEAHDQLLGAFMHGMECDAARARCEALRVAPAKRPAAAVTALAGSLRRWLWWQRVAAPTILALTVLLALSVLAVQSVHGPGIQGQAVPRPGAGNQVVGTDVSTKPLVATHQYIKIYDIRDLVHGTRRWAEMKDCAIATGPAEPPLRLSLERARCLEATRTTSAFRAQLADAVREAGGQMAQSALMFPGMPAGDVLEFCQAHRCGTGAKRYPGLSPCLPGRDQQHSGGDSRP